MMQKMGQDIIYDLRNEVFTHIESLTMRFFDITPVGKIVTRLTNDVDNVSNMLANTITQVLSSAITLVVCLLQPEGAASAASRMRRRSSRMVLCF